jgi:uncharacterized membrane protein HdeD (DUF308 family)
MLSNISRNWWLLALQGTLAVILGVAALVWPGITFEVLVLLFGAYAFINGVIMFGFGLMAAGDNQQWWPLVLGGIIGIATGVLTFAQPAAMGLALVYVVGVWAIVTGLLNIVAAIRLRDIISNEWLMAFGGALSIVFGALVLYQPNAGALTLVWLFGFYAILAGVAHVSLGFRVRGLDQTLQSRSQTVTSSAR